ncbi:transmembrane protein, putative (macronuclear) [Tetrahymena thermophila SB210]|uniref:Transmembrane protein, putative n=1 Tax=Tetrahymena thermophila (strain SB210) TaxID=312017 RepID=I7LW35_TETTS|nr:transmembrane protein, putative [Tetrahymena thermophila SB210]EAS00758.1 transmembrane protein, putative [Tetrahymena thermophila SB210]|eukprot:XP_001021003.1 transmembrane protein, putative [Tetrahymena thermophila SB210]
MIQAKQKNTMLTNQMPLVTLSQSYSQNITVDNSSIYKENMETFSRLFKNLEIKGLQTYNPIKQNRRVIEIKLPEIKKYYFNKMFNTTMIILTISLIASQQQY